MPKLKHKLPNYNLHKASGQTVVNIDGQTHYLGKHGSPTVRTMKGIGGMAPCAPPNSAPANDIRHH